jgi:serine/threonine-protein kinase ULK/ATG1
MNNGVCKISDFGLAKSFDYQDDSTVMASLVGTPLYMSPQILKKAKYSTKSDVWSIGLIFY